MIQEMVRIHTGKIGGFAAGRLVERLHVGNRYNYRPWAHYEFRETGMIGSLLLADIEVEPSARKHRLKQPS